MNRKVVLNLAVSLDGFICDEKGGFDWIVGHGDNKLDTKEQFDFFEFVKNCDIVVMGKKGYDNAPEGSLEIYNDKKIYVLTNSKEKPDRENVCFVGEEILDIIKSEVSRDGKDIYIYGGESVCNMFIKEDLIDEYIVGLIPCVLGKGVKLFRDDNPHIKLSLTNYFVNDGVMVTKYQKRN